ncbi:hypothetical protein ACFL6P_01005 [Candidatus Latescibacterota bacterium]
MNDFQVLLRNKKFITIAIITTASLVTLSIFISLIDFSEVDRSDYSKVGSVFIEESGFIANKLGKVTRVAHIGKGGRSGRESYNVYKVRGEKGSGVCNLTISRIGQNEWYVTSAEIAFSGKNLSVPIKRSEGEKVKKFNLN